MDALENPLLRYVRAQCGCAVSAYRLWQRVLWHFDSSGFDFPAIRLSGIHPELYSIYQAAKTISVGGDNIVIEDLAFSELVSDRAFRLILGALLLCRYGEVVLNLERKTEETT